MSDLNSYTLFELKQIAKYNYIKGYSNLRKDELFDKLVNLGCIKSSSVPKTISTSLTVRDVNGIVLTLPGYIVSKIPVLRNSLEFESNDILNIDVDIFELIVAFSDSYGFDFNKLRTIVDKYGGTDTFDINITFDPGNYKTCCSKITYDVKYKKEFDKLINEESDITDDNLIYMLCLYAISNKNTSFLDRYFVDTFKNILDENPWYFYPYYGYIYVDYCYFDRKGFDLVEDKIPIFIEIPEMSMDIGGIYIGIKIDNKYITDNIKNGASLFDLPLLYLYRKFSDIEVFLPKKKGAYIPVSSSILLNMIPENILLYKDIPKIENYIKQIIDDGLLHINYKMYNDIEILNLNIEHIYDINLLIRLGANYKNIPNKMSDFLYTYLISYNRDSGYYPASDYTYDNDIKIRDLNDNLISDLNLDNELSDTDNESDDETDIDLSVPDILEIDSKYTNSNLLREILDIIISNGDKEWLVNRITNWEIILIDNIMSNIFRDIDNIIYEKLGVRFNYRVKN